MQPNGGGLVSGEGVRLALSSAGVGSRVIAAAVDAAIQFVALLVMFIVIVAVAGSADSAAIGALTIVLTVLVLAGYPIVIEWTTRGRTVGKMCMGLRVVRDDGGPIGFRQALVRGLAGLVLEKPGLLFPLTTIAGVLTTSISTQEKRLGDMMAGTIVLNERAVQQRDPAPPAWVPLPLQAWALALDLQRLDDRLALRVRQFVTRAHAMSPGAQWTLGEQLRAQVLDAVTPPPPWGAPTPDVLVAVLAERRRRAAWAAAPPAPAPVHRAASAPPPMSPPQYAPRQPSTFTPPS